MSVPCKSQPGPCLHDVPHGVVSTYTNHGCRCPGCRAANTRNNLQGRRRRHKAMMAGLVSPPHGVESTYLNYACRCPPCRAEHLRRDQLRRQRRRERT